LAISNDIFSTQEPQNYAEARELIRSGDILLCSGTSNFSVLIEEATKSIWSHVALILRLEDINRVMVLESVESIGVRTVPLSYYAFNYNETNKGYPGKILIARHDQFAEKNISNLSKEAVDLLGSTYDSEHIAAIALHIVKRDLLINNGENIDIGNNTFICSEYVYKCFKSVGITINFNSAGYISPADFANDQAVQDIVLINCSE